MPNISIDFEVFKALTAKRLTEDVTENDVLRDLLSLPPKAKQAPEMPDPRKKGPMQWVTKGIAFPEGTQFRHTHKGKMHTGKVLLGQFWVDNRRCESLSNAAVAITGTPRNGWKFWECKLPGSAAWVTADVIRAQPANIPA